MIIRALNLCLFHKWALNITEKDAPHKSDEVSNDKGTSQNNLVATYRSSGHLLSTLSSELKLRKNKNKNKNLNEVRKCLLEMY